MRRAAHRRSIRLTGYDYSQSGAYFITVCAQDRACLFGEVVGSQMHLNDAGRMVLAEWNSLPVRFPTAELDAFCVMPNHIHGVITISTAGLNTNANVNETVGAGLVPAPVPPAPNVPVADVPIPNTPVAGAPIPGVPVPNVPIPDVPVSNAPVAGAPDPGAGVVSGATTRVAPTMPMLGDIVGAFKSLTTGSYIHGVKQSGWPPFRGRLWQRNYHEHIIRNDRSLNRIRRYILNNPAR